MIRSLPPPVFCRTLHLDTQSRVYGDVTIMDLSNSFLRVHPDDNVLVATGDLPKGQRLRTSPELTLATPVTMGHKIASRSIAAGEPVLKYGQPIGLAKGSISPGAWVHVHNVAVEDHRQELHAPRTLPGAQPTRSTRTFQGFRRANGRAGTRNYLAVVSSVNCSASVSKAIARHFDADRLRDFPNVDGVVAFTHDGGCAMRSLGQQHRLLNRVMGGIAKHPNIGGYLLVGLGCEKASIDMLVDEQQLVQIQSAGDPSTAKRPPTLTMQKVGGTAKTIAAGILGIEQLLPQVNAAEREPIPASELVVATQCGGSDGSSGLTANPAVGIACDRIVDQGGTAILGETTEIVGAEHLMVQRAVSEEVARKLLEKIEWWRWYAGLFGETIDDNRSSGNIAGGLTTIAEKSLGAIAKAGSRPLVQVYEYAEAVEQQGLVVMDSPGYDPVSITGMVAGGANLVVFTTGRGSCYGCKPSPSIKIATNTPMYQRMQDDMDLDAGRILTGTPVAQVGDEIFEMMLAVASGESTKSESQGLGDEEFIPWMIGPIL